MNSSVGDFGDEASDGEEVNGCLIERIGDMGGIHIGDKACFVGEWEGVEMSISKAVERGMVQPRVGGGWDGMMVYQLEAGRRTTRGLESGIWGGRWTIVGKCELSTEERRERGSSAGGESDSSGREDGFKEIKEGLDCSHGIGDSSVKNVAVLA